MSATEVLSPVAPLDFLPSSCLYKHGSNDNPQNLKEISSINDFIDSNLSSILTDTTTKNNIDDITNNLKEWPEDNRPFATLPPLLRGHPDIHLRHGVMQAAARAEENEIDAERAFFVADLSQVHAQHQRWTAALPGIEPFYAVKCNPDPYVIRLLAGLGTGFDCASNAEIVQVLEAGVDGSRIVFANPCKATSFVRSAARSGVDMMTFDNVDELYKIARAHPGAQLIVRILTDDSKSLCRLGLKFGASLESVPGLLNKAKELGLDVIGVSFHVGSGCYDPNAFADAVCRARCAFDYAAEAGYRFRILDVGGGFEDSNFEVTASILSAALDRFFPDHRAGGIGASTVQVIAEPGRFFVSRAFSLATNIIARRAPLERNEVAMSTTEENGEPRVMYYINDGVYGAFNCIMFDHQKVAPYVLSMGGSFHVPFSVSKCASSVWGPTCDSIDCVCPLTELPVGLGVGDWLAFDNMGAYTICAASQFNGFAVSSVSYTAGGGYGEREVRRALMKVAAAM